VDDAVRAALAGGTEAVRRIEQAAARVRRLAGEARTARGDLQRRAEVTWQSVAADRYRAERDGLVAGTGELADRWDALAAVLAAHARTAGERLAVLQGAAARLEAARERVEVLQRAARDLGGELADDVARRAADAAREAAADAYRLQRELRGLLPHPVAGPSVHRGAWP
jgi:hypothetical protein